MRAASLIAPSSCSTATPRRSFRPAFRRRRSATVMVHDDAVIVARGVTKVFGKKTAVDHLDITVRRAEVYGFLGPNGCGKSTTIRMLCGLLVPTAGEVEVLGHKLPQDAETVKRSIGYMTQKF